MSGQVLCSGGALCSLYLAFCGFTRHLNNRGMYLLFCRVLPPNVVRCPCLALHYVGRCAHRWIKLRSATHRHSFTACSSLQVQSSPSRSYCCALAQPNGHPIPRAHWLLIIITGAVGGFSYVMQLSALQHAAAGPFEAMKRVTSQLLALTFGRIHFDEKITIPKIIGIVILSCGVPLIVL